MYFISFLHPEEILERLRAKKEEELEEVKRRAAEEAQKARLEKEKVEVDMGMEDEDVKSKDQAAPEGKVRDPTMEEIKEEATGEIKDGIKTGDYVYFSQSVLKKFLR